MQKRRGAAQPLGRARLGGRRALGRRHACLLRGLNEAGKRVQRIAINWGMAVSYTHLTLPTTTPV